MKPSSGFLRKPFDPKLHEENDGPAKEAVMGYIERNWFLDVVEGGKYDVDLIIIDKGQEVGFGEVECRHNWVRNFPYQTVNVPYRKHKFFTLDLPTILFSVRSDLQQALWCRGDTILQAPVVENRNKYVAAGEKFFAVPLRSWRLVNL